jgi:hypothetical protein
MTEQTYLQKARGFRRGHRSRTGSPAAESPDRAGQVLASDGVEIARVAPPEPQERERDAEAGSESASPPTDELRVLSMLQEMRPYLSRSLQRISDEGLLLLAKWNLHVAAERAIDARLRQGKDSLPASGSESPAKKAK